MKNVKLVFLRYLKHISFITAVSSGSWKCSVDIFHIWNEIVELKVHRNCIAAKHTIGNILNPWNPLYPRWPNINGTETETKLFPTVE